MMSFSFSQLLYLLSYFLLPVILLLTILSAQSFLLRRKILWNHPWGRVILDTDVWSSVSSLRRNWYSSHYAFPSLCNLNDVDVSLSIHDFTSATWRFVNLSPYNFSLKILIHPLSLSFLTDSSISLIFQSATTTPYIYFFSWGLE